MVEPHLIERNQNLNGQGYTHQTTGNHNNKGKAGNKLGNIPGEDINKDRQKRNGNGNTFGQYRHLTEDKDAANEEEDKGDTKQVDMGDANQTLD